MGTIINGNKWSGACVNGSVMSGLVKNGVVFYKKEIPTSSFYKRRVMVGDNLDKKILFFDFPNDFYKNFQNEFVYENYIITCEHNYSLPGIAFSVGLDPNTLDRMDIYDYALGIEGPIYKYDIINNSLKSNMKKAFINVESGESGKVIYITNDSNDSKIYRNIYIEDPYIRPIQAGDLILSTTKFYFTFPDNFYENNTFPQEDFYLAYINNPLGMTNQILFRYDSYNKKIEYYTNFGYTKESFYAIDENNDIVTNISYWNMNNSMPYIISELENESELNKKILKNILVDTRTLGTTGYKRRIMVGDYLNKRYIYSDFPDNYTNNFLDVKTDVLTKIIECNNDFNIIENIKYNNGNISIEIDGDKETIIGLENPIYIGDSINGMINNNSSVYFNPKSTSSSAVSTYKVTTINENESYRHMYVEDYSIRPLQIGDKIINGTKLYFNFPDSLTNTENKTIFSLDTTEDLYLRISSGKIYITDRMAPFVDTLSIEPTEEGFLISKEIFNTEDSLNIINWSTYTYECYGYQEGIPVNEIDNELINYVLVDITTLGN